MEYSFVCSQARFLESYYPDRPLKSMKQFCLQDRRGFVLAIMNAVMDIIGVTIPFCDT